MVDIEKIIIVTKKTWLEELIEKFNTKAQAEFYIEHNIGKGKFFYYQASHDQYHHSLKQLKKIIPNDINYQVIEREYLPNFLFNRTDLVITIGVDGLVINTAKYLDDQTIMAINPDIERVEGVLIPFTLDGLDLGERINKLRNGEVNIARITMAKAELNNGQTLHGVNDLFIGQKTHMSSRYTIEFDGKKENHSSSGIIVSTGCGSTGWFKSVVTGAMAMTKKFYDSSIPYPGESDYRFSWDSNYINFSVREPWISKVSGADINFGHIVEGSYLKIESKMPENGVIFSDGIENDYLDFNSGTIVKIGVSEKKVNLLLE